MSSSVSPALIKKRESIKVSAVGETSPLTYRPDIDGLRALAILAVVVYHAFPTSLTGGFIGVDVFFVISGYLISSIILKGVSTGSFSFTDFYMRRVRRIFPALLLVIFVTYLAGWIIMMGEEYKALSRHIMAGIGFVQNVMMYSEAGYFDASTETKPLMHLWSLGVAGLLFIADTPAGVFFLPQYRVWELLFGAVLAYLAVFKPSAVRVFSSPSVRNTTSFIGVMLVACALYLIDKNKQFPGYWALLPVIGSALLISAGPDAWINKRILSSRIAIFIGLISYPLYLWHWPIFSFAYIWSSGLPIPKMRIALVVLAVVLAWLTYRFVEIPLRRRVSGKNAYIGLVVVAVIFVMISAFTVYKNGFPDRKNEMQEFAAYFANGGPNWHYFTENHIPERFRRDCDWYNLDAFFSGNATNLPVPAIAEKCYRSDKAKKVLFWGDSHAQQYIYGVTQELPKDIAVLSVASSACLPNLPEVDASPAQYCRKSNEFAVETIKDQKPDVVIIGQIIGHDVSNSLPNIASALSSFGVKHVVVMGPVPRWETRLYEIVLRKYWSHTPKYLKDDLVKDVFDSELSLKSKYGAGQGGFQYLSMIDLLCGDQGCRTYVGDDRKIGLTSFDNSHLSPAASVYTAQTALVPLILKDINGE